MPRSNDPTPQLKLLAVDRLLGIDLQNAPAVVAPGRSPHCSNMLRSTPGQVQKRPGYLQVAAYPGAIHGCYRLQGVELLHAGSRLYADGQPLAGTLADSRSTGLCFGGCLYLLDGANFWCVSWQDGALTLQPVTQKAYLPRIAVGKNPDGTGGADLEDVNLLSDGWCESFYGTQTDTVYQLEFGQLSAEQVRVELVRPAADTGTTRAVLTEGVDFSVDRTLGTVTFVTAPGKAPVEGEDNVFITAFKDRSAQRACITQADVCTAYGTPGTGLRLFVTGSPAHKNRDYWSAADDPTYFSDLSYSVLGQDDGRILGYSLLGDSLAAHKSGQDGGVWVRRGSMQTEKDALGNEKHTMVFATGGVITGYGAVAKDSFAVLGDEPLFLTAQGVFALTASDLTGSRYQQRRSYFIDPALTAEQELAGARAVVWRDFYLLALNGRVYCLDGLQKSYTAAAPKSAYQYECYLLENVPAACLWVWDGVLYFGTVDGRVCRFTAGDTAADFSDRLTGVDPVPVAACWETPDISGSRFYKDKFFRRLALRMLPAPATSVHVWARREGNWQPLTAQPIPARYFCFSSLVFSALCFSGDRTSKPISLRLHRRRLDKIRFRFENSVLSEPFGLLGWALEFTEGRNYRR